MFRNNNNTNNGRNGNRFRLPVLRPHHIPTFSQVPARIESQLERKQNTDCLDFFAGTCDGIDCDFRHAPAALGSNEVCQNWWNNACELNDCCPKRHIHQVPKNEGSAAAVDSARAIEELDTPRDDSREANQFSTFFCTICLTIIDMVNNEIGVKILECNHLFCDKCADSMAKVNRCCAHCRKPIKTKPQPAYFS